MWRFIFCAGIVAVALTPAINAQAYILYQDDHKAKALALSRACNDKHCEPITKGSKGIKAPGITTLTVWGHGDQAKFCELTPTEFTDLILAWKKLNPKLKTVEILTCDARHNAMDNLFGPFSNRVAEAVRKKHRDLTIKALPIGQRKSDSSILWANAETATFCYITAPNKTVLEQANKALLAGEKKTGNLAQAANDLAKVKNRTYTLNYGPLKLLRSHLGVVKK